MKNDNNINDNDNIMISDKCLKTFAHWLISNNIFLFFNIKHLYGMNCVSITPKKTQNITMKKW